MTIYFAGGEMGAFTPSDSTVIESTGATYFNGSFARCAIKIPSSSAYCATPTFTSLTEVWLHFDHTIEDAGSDLSYVTAVELLNSSGNARIRMQTQEDSGSGDLWRMQYWNGAAWTTVGSEISLSLADIQTIDINATVNTASGQIILYVAGTERIASGTIDLSGITNIASVRFYGRAGTGTERFISQVIVANESTIGMRLGTIVMTGNGASTSWTNSYLSADEIAYSDADFIYAAAADLVELYTGTSVPSISGYTIRAVAITARAKRGASGPANLQLALRSGSTNYFSANKSLAVAYGAHVNIWETDPDTSTTFLGSAIASLQFGVKSIT